MPGSVREIILQKANEICKSLVNTMKDLTIIFKDQGYHFKDFAK